MAQAAAAAALRVRSPMMGRGALAQQLKLSTVTLDVTGTIISFNGELGDIYCMAAKRCGQVCPDYNRVYNGFKKAYEHMSTEYPCFGHSKIQTKEWWRMCVEQSFQHAGYEYAPPVFEKIFQRIYSAFGSMRAYSKFDDVIPFMKWVKESGLQLGIVSNETERYGDGILPMFGFDEWLDFMIFSKDVGKEKPHPDMFHAAMKAAGEPEAARVLHVGDSFKKDYRGAEDAGLRALLLDRFHTKEAEEVREQGYVVCRDLVEARVWMMEQGLV